MVEQSKPVSAKLEADLRRDYRITPSNISPWYGSWHEGHVFTAQQERELMRLGMDPLTVDRIDVKVVVTAREAWWPDRQPAPHRLLTCPIVGHKLDRLKVIAPHGESKFVYPGGHLTRPKPARGGRYGR